MLTPSPGWLPDILRGERIPVEYSHMKGTGYYRTIGRLVRQVRHGKFNVLHTHLTRAAYIGHIVGLLTDVPIISSVHIANNDQIYRRLARRRNRLVAVSNFVAGMLHGKGVPKQFIETVYNGTDFVDIPAADPNRVKDELGIPRDRNLVGLVGKVCADKGHIELIKAMRDVRMNHPQAHVVFVGLLEETFKDEMEEALEEARLRDHVTLTGVRNDIPRLLDSFTLSTLPSRMETFGVAAIEAMARSKAVVATRVGALPEVVRHQQTGLLVDLRPDEIAEAVSYLLANGDEREEMGRRGRYVVEQKFTLSEMASRFEGVYRRAIDS
ncbi:glycosyltransferase [Fimbriimonas ginsengisoli Gsoil 348]|uniref:Glycosyltransferase n=1 Tax=Fimbriimonas ginsengisoli Gsoil 348 TaxID=661478 RepID=A0A068NTW3_FIMGI|nr:glycosyltransferase [Fimbriimonas ginsengisoli Gsoil 348]